MECFCGCGQKVPRFPLGVRSINKRGKVIAEQVGDVAVLLDAGMKSPNAEAYVEDGKAMLAALATAVHTRDDSAVPGDLENATRNFMRTGRERFGDAALGRGIAESGVSYEDAMAALRRGELDPFAD